MRKILQSLFLITVLCLSYGTVYASDFGSISSIDDQIVPDGENAIIYQSVSAVTNDAGEVSIPFNKKNEIVEVNAISGNISSMPQTVEVGDNKYQTLVFEEKNSDVAFMLVMQQEGFYVGEEADLGDTFPKDALELSYKFQNNTPINIGSYSLKIAAPKETELLNIVDYSAKKAFSITKENENIYGGFDFGKLVSGKEVKLAINVYTPNKGKNMLLIIGAILISVAYMLKNKDLLKQG